MPRLPLADVITALDAAYKTGAMPTDAYTSRRQWAEANVDAEGRVDLPDTWLKRSATPSASAPAEVPGRRLALGITVLGWAVVVLGVVYGISGALGGAVDAVAWGVGAVVGGGLLLAAGTVIRLLRYIAERP